jgi:hypothetical protein
VPRRARQTQANASITHYADKFGRHELKFGAEFERSKVRNRYGYVGGLMYYDVGGQPYVAYSYGYDVSATHRLQNRCGRQTPARRRVLSRIRTRNRRLLRFTATGIWRDSKNFVNSALRSARWTPTTVTNSLTNQPLTGYSGRTAPRPRTIS